MKRGLFLPHFALQWLRQWEGKCFAKVHTPVLVRTVITAVASCINDKDYKTSKTTERGKTPNVKVPSNGTFFFILLLKQQYFQKDVLIMNK